jgi:hypothetical protein
VIDPTHAQRRPRPISSLENRPGVCRPYLVRSGSPKSARLQEARALPISAQHQEWPQGVCQPVSLQVVFAIARCGPNFRASKGRAFLYLNLFRQNPRSSRLSPALWRTALPAAVAGAKNSAYSAVQQINHHALPYLGAIFEFISSEMAGENFSHICKSHNAVSAPRTRLRGPI